MKRRNPVAVRRVNNRWTTYSSRAERARKFLLLPVLSYAMAAGVLPLSADIHDWNDPGGGVYGTFTKWNPIPFPAPDDTARFLLDAEYTVSFIESRTAADVQFGNGTIVTFDGSGILGVGDRTYTVNDALIGAQSSLTIRRVISDRDLNWNVADALEVQGELSIQDSTIVTSSQGAVDSDSDGSTANVFVTGTDGASDPSTWNVIDLQIGIDHRGKLSIEGGAVGSTETATLGLNSSSDGEVEVVGASAAGLRSTWTTTSPEAAFVIGSAGDGHLSVLDGALATSQAVSMGTMFGGNGSAVVSGVGAGGDPSTWTTRDIAIGLGGAAGGSGSLDILDGGFVSSGNASIGFGSVNVLGARDGNRSTWIVDELTVGDDRAAASLSISENGNVSSGTTFIGRQTAPGTILLDARGTDESNQWSSSGDVYVGGNEAAAGGSGDLLIRQQGAQVDIAGTLKIWDDGEVELTGGALLASIIDHSSGGEFDFQSGLLQVDQFDGDLVNQGGTLSPGPDASSTLIDGDYAQQPEAVLAVDIGGLAGGIDHDELLVTGLFGIGGQLQVSVINNFRPSAEDLYTVAGGRLVNGSFTNVATGERVETTDGAGSFIVHYGATSAMDPQLIILADYQEIVDLLGDYNLNGIVDAPDYNVWRDTFGSDTLLDADGNGNGLIDAPDYTIWRDNFGNVVGSAVPEPSTAWLLACGIAAGRSRRRRS